MKAPSRWALVLLALAAACPGAPREPVHASPPAGPAAFIEEYRAFLDQGRTPSRAIAFALERAGAWRVVDPSAEAPGDVKAGDRLVFVGRARTALFVLVGEEPLAAGARLIGAHIDTPGPRLSTSGLTEASQKKLSTWSYGGTKDYQWLHRPLAAVGRIAGGEGEIEIELGLHDDFALYAVEGDKGGDPVVVTGSAPPAEKTDPEAAKTFVAELHRRYGIDAEDLETAEIYLVPKEKARDVGLDRRLLGAHGQDDRANSYAAFRAILDVAKTPRRTAMVWLVDREEVGSTGPTGARSRFFELAYAWLLRAQGEAATEASLGRALAATEALSADTPACLNPNWTEVHEKKHAPVLGRGPAIFPFTGRGGKQGGSAAHAELIAGVMASFDRAGVPLQKGQLGKVDEGGGGTIAKYLGYRGVDAVDVGICVVSMHSPLELMSKADAWSAYRGFHAWLKE